MLDRRVQAEHEVRGQPSVQGAPAPAAERPRVSTRCRTGRERPSLPEWSTVQAPPPPPYLVDTPRPSPRTTRARRVPHPVLIGRIASSSSRPASLALALAFRRGGGGGGGGGGREGVYSRDTGRGNSREGWWWRASLSSERKPHRAESNESNQMTSIGEAPTCAAAPATWQPRPRRPRRSSCACWQPAGTRRGEFGFFC